MCLAFTQSPFQHKSAKMVADAKKIQKSNNISSFLLLTTKPRSNKEPHNWHGGTVNCTGN